LERRKRHELERSIYTKIMSIRLLSVQSSKNSWLADAGAEFSEKINHFHKFELVLLKSAKKARVDSLSKKQEESEMILKLLKSDDYVILFDEKGQSLTSTQFSGSIQKLQTSGTKRINFIIGGAFGVDEKLKKRAQKTIKISDFVLNHHVALIVSLEQIYRAFAIIHNKPYHNE
jgi:23S rRNA (pseudouridine1915-N3)-methyltransferase